MNAWAQIVQMLAENQGLREVIIAPNAPPVGRGTEEPTVLRSWVFTADDVAETLTGAATLASGRRSAELGHTGSLSVGVRDVGRIRITYFTQRGSRVLRIVRVPFAVPSIDAVCGDPRLARAIAQAIREHRHQVILVYGPDPASYSSWVYALLGELNKTMRGVIHIVERSLSFLLAHDNCIVVQTEAGTDTQTLEEAAEQSISLDPDVAYLGDIRVTDQLPSLPQLIGSTACTILSVAGDDPMLLLGVLPKPLHHSLIERGDGVLLRVSPGADGRLKVDPKPWATLKSAG